MLRPAIARAFRPDSLFHPRSVVLADAETETGTAVAANMAGFRGRFDTIKTGAAPGAAYDLAVLACAASDVAATLATLGRTGTFAAVCLTPAPDLAAAAKAAGVRVLGPSSFGIVIPALGLNASAAHVPVRAGKVALVAQSAALCRTVLDWAGPNGVGFSHVVGMGGNADIGFSIALDWLSRDPGTGAILLDIRTIRDRRAFLAAARAAARLRPVVALRSGGRLADPSGRSDAVFDAALRRVGVLRVTGLANFLGAAEVLTRARPPRSEHLAIVTNAVGPGHMAADAAVGEGLSLLAIDDTARTLLAMHLPPGPTDPGIVWTGADQPLRVAEAAAMVAGLPGTGGVIAILAPTGEADAAAVAALAAGRPSLRVPLIACVPGETTGAVHRRTLADAGVPVFATPELAVRAFGQLVRQRRARAAAAELPSRRVLTLAPDHAAVAAILARARAAGRNRLMQDEALPVLAAYGVTVVPQGLPVRNASGGARELRITVADDVLFGPAISFGLGGTAADLLGDAAYELPPLNLALALALVRRTRAGDMLAGLHNQAAADPLTVADALVRVSQLMLDHPEIAALDINPLFADRQGVAAADAWIGLRPAGQKSRFAITPYPADLAQPFDARGETLLIRPIRPEDAEAHAALFRRLSPEDIRYRFFNALRELQAEQIARMTQVDYDREMAFVAVRDGAGGPAETVGVGRLVREPGTDGGEFAIVVDPAMKGKGVAKRIMQRLIDWGRSQGMKSITGQVLAENAPMLAFMRKMGAEIRRLPDEPDVVEAVIAVGPGTR